MDLLLIFSLVSLLAVTSHGAPARFINIDAVAWLRKFGYLPTDTNSNDITLGEYRIAIEEMQERYQIPVTGDIDILTEIEMMIPRCGVPDTEGRNRKGSVTARARRYATTGRKWNKARVSYGITTYTSDMSTASQDAIVREAFRVWSQVIPITLYEETSSTTIPDIEIGFFTGYHGDNFDFNDQTLAHAYDPGTSHRLEGDIHLNDAIFFTDGSRRDGFYLLPVLVHEIGHALGLGHSLERGSVMHHTYGALSRLSKDDIAGIQAIYGSVAVTSPSVVVPTARVVNRPTSYDAIYSRNGILYLIKGTTVYRQYPSGANAVEVTLSQIWPSHPGGVDSGTVFGERVIFVYGNRFYRYADSSSSGLPGDEEYLTALLLPDRIDHVFAVPSENCLYFFEGNDYYQMCEGALQADSPQSIVNKFGAGAVGTDAAFPLNDEIIFVKNTLCYSYDTSTGQLRGPRDFSKDLDFTKCRNGVMKLSISPLLVMMFLAVKKVFA